MGVRGLTAFFNQNPDLFKSYELHDSTVVIDGNNIIHVLYSSYKVNFMFGGDYKKYAEGVRKYFHTYLECNIKPVIVFDGGFDKSNRKLRTIIDRSKKRLTQVQYIVKHGYCSGLVLPILAFEIFYSVLRELNIPFANSDFEADDQIATLANFNQCPVVSGDSDFYIFDIHHGFIHLNFIDTNICKKKVLHGSEYKYLSCKIYFIEKFVSYFPGLDKKALPLFGTLVGNDFVKEGEFANFFSHIHLPKYKGCKLISSAKQKKIIGLLHWLQTNKLNEAIEEIVQFMKKEKRDYIKSVIKDSVEGYESDYCNLLSLICQNNDQVKDELSIESRLTTPCGNSLPSNFIMKFHLGHLPAFFINVIVSHRVFLQPQIEIVSHSSSYNCSLFIRQVIYGILVRHDSQGLECCDETCLSAVQEHDRQRNSLSKELVSPVLNLDGIGMLPKLNEIPHLHKSLCKDIILRVLKIEMSLLSNVPKKWHLYIACVNYWLRNCEPYSSKAFMYAITLNLIYLGLIKTKDGIHELDLAETCKDVKCLCEKIPCILFKTSKSEKKHAEKRLEKYTHKPSINHGNPLQLSIIHSYSQLQSCILFSIYLNKLLNYPMESICPDKCLSGTLLYNIAKDVSSRSNPELFVAEILGRDSNVFSLFIQLNLKMCQGVSDNRLAKNVSSAKRNKKSKRTENLLDVNEENIDEYLSALEM